MKMVTVQLNVKDRLVLLGTLPSEGTFLEIKLLQSLKDELSLGAKEQEDLKVTQLDKGVVWDMDAAKEAGPKTIEIPEITFGLVVKVLNNLDKQSKLTADHIGLYEIFVVKPQNKEE